VSDTRSCPRCGGVTFVGVRIPFLGQMLPAQVCATCTESDTETDEVTA